MKKIIALLLALVLALSLVACASSDTSGDTTTDSTDTDSTETTETTDSTDSETEEAPETSGDAAAGEPLTIGLSMYTLEYPFYVTMHDAFKAACEAKGWECIVTNASTDVATQLNNSLDLINQGIDALALTSWYGDSLAEVFDTCEAEGIPVFLMDTSTIPEGATYVTRIGTVNLDAGYVGGTYVAQYFTEQGIDTVRTVALHTGDQVSTDRRDGFLNGLADGGITVDMLNEYFSSAREESMANMEDALTTYPEIDLVLGTSAQHGLGAYGACVSAGRTEMKILAMDGEQEEMDAIDTPDSVYLATVTQDPAGMAETIVQNIEDYIFNGATFEQFQSAPAGVYTPEGQLSAADLGIS